MNEHEADDAFVLFVEPQGVFQPGEMALDFLLHEEGAGKENDRDNQHQK
jgi:hypothetical protein